MKKIFTINVLIFVSFSMLLISCKTKKERADFTLDLIVTFNLDGGTDNLLPDDIKQIYSPVENDNCTKRIFVSSGKIKRVDIATMPEVIIKDEDNLSTWVQKKTSGQTTKMIRDNIAKSLSGVSIKNLLSNSNPSLEDKIAGLNQYLNLNNHYDLILVYSDQMKTDTVWNTFKLLHSPDSIQNSLSLLICQNSKSKILIIYNPPTFENKDSVIVNQPQIGSNGNGSSSDNGADALYKILHQKRITCQPSDRTKLDEELKKAELTYPTDYRFTFERSVINVYGHKTHNEAFMLIYNAAEKSIKSGKAKDLIQVMNSEGELKGVNHDYWRLTDHPEWTQIMKALNTNNQSLIPTAFNSAEE